MYGLWLYKDLATEYGKCRVEIHQKEYNGESIEIEAFAGDSLSIALDNLSEIISPIGKSVCSFGIINTNQFNYDILFTPDATKFMVVVKTMVTGQEWLTRWSGFLTPDFFAEDLQYRSIISLSARDGIGQLNDIDFTYDGLLLTIQTLIQTAFSKVSPEYPMEVVIDTKKVIDGYTLDSVYIAADLFKGKSWGEAIETVLHDCGLQMRWIDNNTIAIYDLSAMPEQFANQSVQFINGSGYREILPAWKTLSQNQDYKIRGNLYDGVANAELMVLDHSELAYYPFGGAPQQNYVNYYKLLSQWTTAWNAYTGKNMNDPLSGVYISGAIDAKEKEQNYIFYKRDIQYSNYPVKIKLKTSKTIHYCEAPSLYPETLAPYDLYNPADPDNTGYVQLSLFVSIILHADNGQDYYLGREWYQYNNTSQGMSVMKFTLNQATYGNISAEDIEIEAQGIPYNGELSIRIHGYQMEDFKYVRVNDNYPYPDWNAFFAKIEDVTIEFDNNNLPSGVNMGVTINEAHNIKKDEDYTLNTLPNGIGGETAIVNGLYNSNGNSLYFAQLNNQTEEYTLLELVGREAIHYNIKNYEKLSGDIKAVDNKPLLFNSCYKYNGKTFIPYAYSLSVISNTMNITSMQEVEPYVTAELTEIHSEIATGGGSTVGGGNNIALQYSSNAGNAKRIYELDNASEDDVKGAYIVVDKAGLTEAKKFNLQDIAEMTDWFTLQTLESGEKVLMTPYNLASQQSISWKGVSPSQGGGGGGLIQRVYGYDNITDVFDNSVKTDTFNAYTIAKIAERVSDIEKNGVGGDVDLTGYATENWVLNQGYLTSVSFSEILNKPTTLAGYGITDNVAYCKTWNDLLHDGNEFTFAKAAHAGIIWINYRTASGLADGAITEYRFANGAGRQYADIVAAKYIVNGGTSSQFLKADGSLDSTTYLPLSGGTIEGNYNALEVKRSSNNPSVIKFSNTVKTLGYIGVDNDTLEPVFHTAALDASHYLIHSGNIGDYALKTDGSNAMAVGINWNNASIGTNVDTFGEGLIVGRTTDDGTTLHSLGYKYASVLNASNGIYRFQIASSVNNTNKLLYRGYDANAKSYYAWKTIAFTDSNVASATKLQTARTIWGQSFDGTGDVRGSINLESNKLFWHSSDTNYYIGTSYTIATDAPNIDYAGYSGHRFLCAGSERMRITRGGNILIGTTTDDGTSKLQVNGNVSIGPAISLMGTSASGSAKFVIKEYSANKNGIHLYVDTNNSAINRPLTIQNGYGNVLIGTYTDDGVNKLQVNGNISATGSISWGAASDRRLKDNIKTISNEDAINVIMALNPVTFEWNKTATEKDNSLKGLSCGFVADEYTKVIPNSSRPIWEEYTAINYQLTAAFVVKGLQSHEERLRVLERENRELKNELNKLRGYGNC